MSYIQYEHKSKKMICMLFITILGFIFSIFYLSLLTISRSSLEALTTMNWILLLTILIYMLPKGISSICFIFFVVFSIFHAGLIFANTLNGITDEDTIYQISFWFHSTETTNAIYLINLAFIGFTLAALQFSTSKYTNNNKRQEQQHTQHKRLYHIGGIVLSLSIALFFVVGITTGSLHSYGSYLSVTSTNLIAGILFTYSYVFMGLALVLIAVSHQKIYGYHYFILFLVWSAFAFKLGLRGEVMFPSAVTACILCRKGITINSFIILLCVFIFLVVTGIVKTARVSGDYTGSISFNPLNSIAEMGASLRPVQEAIKWRVNGDPLLMGASYWAPFERQLALFIPGIHRKPALQDSRLLNVVVNKRAGPIGFSPVAEAYLNFGEKGVLIIFFLIGTLLAYFDNLKSKVLIDILIGVSLIPLFIMIRNSFAHVPVQIIISQAFALGCIYFSKIKYRW